MIVYVIDNVCLVLHKGNHLSEGLGLGLGGPELMIM